MNMCIANDNATLPETVSYAEYARVVRQRDGLYQCCQEYEAKLAEGRKLMSALIEAEGKRQDMIELLKAQIEQLQAFIKGGVQ